MQVLTLLSKKKRASNSATTSNTSGSVRVYNGNNTTVDGQTINPAVVNAATINAASIYSNIISNNDTITTNKLNSVDIQSDSIGTTTLSASMINTGVINAVEHSTFTDGITAYNISNFDDINTRTITNSELITTKDLEVTGTAHFYELVIDKVRAAGGSVLITPADGFKIDDATLETLNVYAKSYTYAPVEMTCPVLWFRAEDGGRAIHNMWQPYDQAICANFNEVNTAGQYIDASNNYWWYMVGATDNDNLGGSIDTLYSYSYVDVPINEYTSYTYFTYSYTNTSTIYDNARLHPIYNKNGDYIDTVPCHYIALVPQSLDGEPVRDSSSVDLSYLPNLRNQIGNEVAMLGHNKRNTRTDMDTKNRRSAIYMSCYNNFLDSALKPPLFAHYSGINDFTSIGGKRLTKFDASGGEIIGSFKVQAGGTTTDLDTYITNTVGTQDTQLTCTADMSNAELDTIVLQANESGYIKDMNNFPNYLNIAATYQNTLLTENDYSSLTLKLFGTTYDLLNLQVQPVPGILPNSVTWNQITQKYDVGFRFEGLQAQVDSSVIEIDATVVVNGTTYNIYKAINMPVLKSAKGQDADLYMLSAVTEQALVDENGLLSSVLRYQLKHCVSTNVEYMTQTNGYRIQLIVRALDNTTLQTLYLDDTYWHGNYWEYTYDQSNWYGLNSNEKIFKATVNLLDTNNNVVDRRELIVATKPTALFEVQDGLMRSIQASTESSYTYTMSKYSSIVQTTSSLTMQVGEMNAQLGGLQSYSYAQFSQINQRADNISLSVNNINNGLQQTGIDITNGLITLNANNVVFTNDVEVKGNINAGLFYSKTFTVDPSYCANNSVRSRTLIIDPTRQSIHYDGTYYYLPGSNIYLFNDMPRATGSNDLVTFLQLPDATTYDGIEIRVFLLMPSTSAQWSSMTKLDIKAPSNNYLWAPRYGMNVMTTSSINTTVNGATHSVMTAESTNNNPRNLRYYPLQYSQGSQGDALMMLPNVPYLYKAINGSWFVIDGLFTGES